MDVSNDAIPGRFSPPDFEVSQDALSGPRSFKQAAGM